MQFKDIAGKLAAIGLPLLGAAVAGPGGAVAMKGLAAALGLGTEATAEQTAAALGNVSGEQLVAIRAIEADLAKAQLQSDTAIALEQIKTNQGETQAGAFKGGWRPMAGWASVFVGLIYPPIRALLPWGLKVAGVHDVPDLPPLDATEALTCLGGLLGLATLRSNERKAGKA